MPDPSGDQVDDAEAYTKLTLLDTVFRPSAPIDRDELFSGRGPQRWSIFEAIRSPGQHAVILGERGVGKTSLAATIAAIGNETDGRIGLLVTCDNGDNFNSVWQKCVDEFAIYLASNPNHSEEIEMAMERAAEVLQGGDIAPSAVRIALRHVTAAAPLVIFIDEFNEIVDRGTSMLFSNLVKMLSDKIEPVTLVIVGVAETVETLISNHQSINRNLSQVRMPRMGRDELAAIASRGFEHLGMRTNPDVIDLISTLPCGLPQYAHLIAQEAARQALINRTLAINIGHVLDGLRVGLGKVDHTLSAAYNDATYSARASHFREVLLACALASRDEYGYFAPSEVRGPYSMIMNEPMDYPHFNPHLTMFVNERGTILSRTGEERRWRYRFNDPLMEPYVLLKGLDDGLIKPDQILGRVSEPSETGRLFALDDSAAQP
jgi:hypothetical protein